MSVDELDFEVDEATLDEPVTVCPVCREDGEFPGLSDFTTIVEESPFPDREGTVEKWVRFHCRECDVSFAVMVHDEDLDVGGDGRA